MITFNRRIKKIKRQIAKILVKYSGPSKWRRLVGHLIRWRSGPYYDLTKLSKMVPQGFISPFADIKHERLLLGRHVLIDDRVTIYQSKGGGSVEVGDNVHIYRDTIIQTGQGGYIKLAPNLVIQPRCQFSAYKGSIKIRSDVQIAPNCAFYPYSHGVSASELIYKQPLSSKGGILIKEDAWLGFGVIILDGVTVGKGAIIGAGSVVTKSIPDGSVAAGNPAKIIGIRRQNGIERCTV